MKVNHQQSLVLLSDIDSKHEKRILLDAREVRLRINSIGNIKIGEFLEIIPEEKACFNNVFAIDVSTVKLGVSYLGEVHAIRGATVIKKNDSLTINRTRPMIVFGEISDAQISFELEEQFKSISSARDSIILLDGDLNEITSISRPAGLFDSLKTASNVIVSISKGFVIPSVRLPKEVEDSPFIGSVLNGRSDREYLVRFKLGSPILKIEIYPKMELEELSKVLASLIFLDGVEYGYPETLRIAHIYSKILPVDALTLRYVIQKKFGIEVLREIDNRKILLGGFWS